MVNVSEEMKGLMVEREALESEIKTLTEFLTEDGMPGLDGPLVDKEGFPRADLDVYAIRNARNRLACAQTDHKEVMKKLEQALFALHSNSRVDVPRPVAAPSTTAAAESSAELGAAQAIVMEPFALIDEVSEGSPAAESGLRVGDRVCSFGGVSRQATGDLHACFAAIAKLVPASEGAQIDLVIKRGDAADVVTVQLRPRKWAGRGLLGCHMDPIRS
mmetsp:Transcript_62651/g.149447  ORF Transcript_62651/g.149447 Transcript_62651/m.149447 type:complete len:217 (-) Transcript_62651:153-803(-)